MADNNIRITLAVRKTTEVSQVIEVDHETLVRLENGDNPFYDKMLAMMDTKGETQHDYAVLDENGEDYIVPWS